MKQDGGRVSGRSCGVETQRDFPVLCHSEGSPGGSSTCRVVVGSASGINGIPGSIFVVDRMKFLYLAYLS